MISKYKIEMFTSNITVSCCMLGVINDVAGTFKLRTYSIPFNFITGELYDQ